MWLEFQANLPHRCFIFLTTILIRCLFNAFWWRHRCELLDPPWSFGTLPGPSPVAVRAAGMPRATLSVCPHKTWTSRKVTYKVMEGEAVLIKFSSAGCLISILPWAQAHLHSWFITLIWILQLLQISLYLGPSWIFLLIIHSVPHGIQWGQEPLIWEDLHIPSHWDRIWKEENENEQTATF